MLVSKVFHNIVSTYLLWQLQNKTTQAALSSTKVAQVKITRGT